MPKTQGSANFVEESEIRGRRGKIIWIPEREKGFDGFMMTFQDMMAELDKDPEMTPVTTSVLVAMMNRMEYENRINVRMGEIARIKRIRPQSVSRAVNVLVRKGVLVEIEEDRVGKVKVYRLNSMYGYKGRIKNWKKLLEVDGTPAAVG